MSPQGEDEAPAVVLRVVEASLEDVDRGFVRADPYHLAQIGVQAGMVVAITGQRRTVTVAQPLPRSHHGLRQIQMDGMMRQNARAAVDEQVTVCRVEAFPARTLLLSPIDPGR